MPNPMETALPPFISTADSGSFAMRTIMERKPRIIERVLATNIMPPNAEEALKALAREIREGTVEDPFTAEDFDRSAFENGELRSWEREIARHAGARWLALPWYFAQAYFYLRLLFAFGWYARPPAGRDPFHAQKEQELTGPGGGRETARGIAARKDDLRVLLHAALWGNRVDLGNFELDETCRRSIFETGRTNLLIDHTESALTALSDAREVHFILDNAGPELVCDLLLAECLMQKGGIGASGTPSIVLHVKRSPFFVSDAMAKDVTRAVEALSADGDREVAGIGLRLGEAIACGRLTVAEHWFWNSPLHFTEFPSDLRLALSQADLVLVKGDANYRRLLEDRKWETWRVMEELAHQFPAPFVALRTMKSEIVVDVLREEAAVISREDPGWLIDGRRGIIRHCVPRRRPRGSPSSADRTV